MIIICKLFPNSAGKYMCIYYNIPLTHTHIYIDPCIII